jgi:beta-lactamase regulating signal transducer with metallopeptidase domain
MLENATALLLINGLIGGSLVLLAGGVLCLLVREPVYRLRLIGVTLFATVLAVGVSVLPGMPRWSLLTSAQQEAVQTAVAMPVVESARNSDATARALVAATEVDSGSAAPDSTGQAVFASRISAETAQPASSARRSDDRDAESAGAVVSQFSSPVVPPEFLPQLTRAFATGYLLSVVGLVLWWSIGVGLLIRMIRAARPANGLALKLLREIAGEDSDSVRLVISDRVRQPVACRAHGRVIMLPESLAENGSRQELQFAIAHEWSHIERGDWWLWSLANLLRAAFLFHPAVWWLRREVRLCQDFLADARAADQPGCRIDYAEFLTKQATIRRQPVLAAGLGMRGRRSELYQRVLLLVKQEQPLETQCSHHWAWATLIVFLGVGIVAGSGQVFTGETRRKDAGAASSSAERASTETGAGNGSVTLPGDAPSSTSDLNSGAVLSEDELQVQFEDQNESLCFQLTAVSEPGGARSLWWEPNGKPLKQSSLQRWLSAESMPAHNPNANRRVFLLQFWKHDRVSVRWLIDGVATTLFSSESVEIGDRRLTTVMFGGAFAEKTKSASVRVGYAAGPWRTAVVLPGSAKETAIVKKSGGAVVGFEIPIPSPATSQDIRVVAKLESGNEEAATLVKSDSGSLVAQFRGFQADAVGEYRLESRPFRWLKFENVSLASGVATSCRVLRDSLGPQPMSAKDSSGSQAMFTAERGNSTGISAGSPPSREELLYDGRSFRQWRRELLTELNPSRRAEAMRAFSAFGRNGYTKEAAGAILDATRKMRRTKKASDQPEPAAQFRQAALTALLDLKPESVVEVLAERMKTLDEENVDFIADWIEAAASDDRLGKAMQGALTDQLSAFLKATESTDAHSRTTLLNSLRGALPEDARLKK